MSFHLKKQRRSKGIYLQIVESYWDPDLGKDRQRGFCSPGYICDLENQGIADPVSVYMKEVEHLNAYARREREEIRQKKIDGPPRRYCGYFPLKQIWNGLELNGFLDLLQSTRNFKFRIAELLQALTYAQVIEPCSKQRALEEVLPMLYERYEFSYDQLLSGLEFIGREYEKIVETLNHQIRKKYELKTGKVYMDCTNFWFEIDREDELRRKGPSKENRHDPIIGLGLLLDENLVPFGMRMYPGNESEKPILREMIAALKTRACIQGRTIQVADKGLNCAENILRALTDGDGYIFSKSVKMLPDVEKTWVLLDRDWTECGTAPETYYVKECVAEFPYVIRDKCGKIIKKFTITEKRVATFNPSLARKQRPGIDRLVRKAEKLTACVAKRDEFGECSKYVTFSAADRKGSKTGGKVTAEINSAKIEEDRRLAGYNLIVTSELDMDKHTVYSVYHHLWRIEETFKSLKSYLNARPVFLQRPDRIFGHFLICYVGMVLTRIFQFYILKSELETEPLFRFMRSVQTVRSRRDGWINLTPSSECVTFISRELRIPITNYFLTTQQINALFTRKI